MEVAIRRMGNSQGIVIPKPILAQLGLGATADLQVIDGRIVIGPVRPDPREGWAQDALRVAAAGDDAPAWPEFGNADDAALEW